MNAVIISIGDELLIGQVINTNAAFIAQQLNGVGIDVVRVLTVADTAEAVLSSFRESYDAHDAVIVTGGLGPTHDDITRRAVCAFFDTDLVADEQARANIEAFLRARGRPWSAAADDQTLVPRGATVIPNRRGTAPGEFFHRDGKYVIVMPGVPAEMKGMMEEFVIPYFQRHATGAVILHRTLNTTGIAESELAERLGDLEALLQGERLAFLPSAVGVRLRITVRGSDEQACRDKLLSIEQAIRTRARNYIFGTGDQRLEDVLGELLAERKLSIAVAESCTGGLLADLITDVPGSSRYFERGVVTYSNASKIALLGVSEELLATRGAVSREVAEAMASGIRRMSGTDIGLSTTGIAGPAGGSEAKPVGLVWIGYADARETIALKFQLGNDRLRIKERAAHAAMELARRKILGRGG